MQFLAPTILAGAALATAANAMQTPARPGWLSEHAMLRAAESDDGSVWYVDPLQSDFRARPLRVVVRVDETGNPSRTRNNTVRIAEINCAAHRYRILRTKLYDDLGNVSEDDERGDGSMEPVIPGSVFDGVEQTACQRAGAAVPRAAWLSSGRWVFATYAEDGSVWYFDPSQSDFATRPTRVAIRVDETGDSSSPYNNTLRIAEIDCAAHRYRILRTTHYDNGGRASEDDERGDGSMAELPEGSVLFGLARETCQRAQAPGSTSTDAR